MKKTLIIMLLLVLSSVPAMAQLGEIPFVETVVVAEEEVLDFSSNGSVIFDKSFVGVNLDDVTMVHLQFGDSYIGATSSWGQMGQVVIKLQGEQNYDKILAAYQDFFGNRSGNFSETIALGFLDGSLKVNNKFLSSVFLRHPSPITNNKWELKLGLFMDQATYNDLLGEFRAWSEGKMTLADSGESVFSRPARVITTVYETYTK